MNGCPDRRRSYHYQQVQRVGSRMVPAPNTDSVGTVDADAEPDAEEAEEDSARRAGAMATIVATARASARVLYQEYAVQRLGFHVVSRVARGQRHTFIRYLAGAAPDAGAAAR